jgi:teichuronic acid biosynthesis glycosyltransferase TuaC
MARVAFVTTSYPREPGDPAGHFVEAEVRASVGRGDFVTVFAPGAPPERDVPGVTVAWLPGGGAFGWPGALARLRERPWRALDAARFVLSARRALGEHGPFDRVVAHWLVPSAWPVAAYAPGALEVVLHGSDVRLVAALPKPLRLALVTPLIARRATFRFVSSELRERLIRATTPSLRALSRVEPSPVDVTGAPNRAEARERLGLDGHARLAVVVGRLVASKRPEAALELALRERPDRVVFVGEGPLGTALVRAHSAVTVTGKVPRPIALQWIAAADVLVTASREEGAPTVVREARALGTRVVAVPAGDVETWARADAGISVVRD